MVVLLFLHCVCECVCVWATYREGLQTGREQQLQQQEELTQPTDCVCCQIRGRSFRRESDKKQHKCVEERSKPEWEQHGAVWWADCQRWFRSRGGLTVHRCLGTGSTWHWLPKYIFLVFFVIPLVEVAWLLRQWTNRTGVCVCILVGTCACVFLWAVEYRSVNFSILLSTFCVILDLQWLV